MSMCGPVTLWLLQNAIFFALSLHLLLVILCFPVGIKKPQRGMREAEEIRRTKNNGRYIEGKEK